MRILRAILVSVVGALSLLAQEADVSPVAAGVDAAAVTVTEAVVAGPVEGAEVTQTRMGAFKAKSYSSGKNFLHLMKETWPDLLKGTGAILLMAVVFGLVLGVVGIPAGVLAWLVAYRRRWLEAPWRWYAWVAWLWPVLFVGTYVCAFAVAGAWMGAGRTVNRMIQDDRVLDRICLNLMVVYVLDDADYELRSDDVTTELKTVFADSTTVIKHSEKDWEALEGRIDTSLEGHPVLSWLSRFALRHGVDIGGDLAGGADLRMVVLELMQHDNIDLYVQEHPDVGPGMLMLARHISRLRSAASKQVSGFVRGNVVVCVLCLLIPFAAAWVLQLGLWGVPRIRDRWRARRAARAGVGA